MDIGPSAIKKHLKNAWNTVKDQALASRFFLVIDGVPLAGNWLINLDFIEVVLRANARHSCLIRFFGLPPILDKAIRVGSTLKLLAKQGSENVPVLTFDGVVQERNYSFREGMLPGLELVAFGPGGDLYSQSKNKLYDGTSPMSLHLSQMLLSHGFLPLVRVDSSWEMVPMAQMEQSDHSFLSQLRETYDCEHLSLWPFYHFAPVVLQPPALLNPEIHFKEWRTIHRAVAPGSETKGGNLANRLNPLVKTPLGFSLGAFKVTQKALDPTRKATMRVILKSDAPHFGPYSRVMVTSRPLTQSFVGVCREWVQTFSPHGEQTSAVLELESVSGLFRGIQVSYSGSNSLLKHGVKLVSQMLGEKEDSFQAGWQSQKQLDSQDDATKTKSVLKGLGPWFENG